MAPNDEIVVFKPDKALIETAELEDVGPMQQHRRRQNHDVACKHFPQGGERVLHAGGCDDAFHHNFSVGGAACNVGVDKCECLQFVRFGNPEKIFDVFRSIKVVLV